jgi:hypothetical protein
LSLRARSRTLAITSAVGAKATVSWAMVAAATLNMLSPPRWR